MDDFFARIRLSAYLDGELTDAEMAEVARALEEQPELRAAYEELRAAVDLVRRHGPVQAPARLHAAIMREVEAEPRARRWFARLLGPVGRFPGQALGIVVVAAAVLLVVLRGPTIEEPLPPAALEAERTAAAPAAEEGAEGAGPGEAGPGPEPAPAQVGPPGTEAEPPQKPLEKALGKDDLGRVGSGAARGVGGSGKDASGVPIGELLATKGGATYVPEWDKEQVSAGDAKVAQAVAREEAGSPFAYRLTPTSSDALRRLVAIAEKLDGRALDAQGQPLDPLPLTDENNHARVVLVLPASRLEKLEGYLRSLGGLVTVVADDERLLSEDSVRVEIEVLYNP